MTHNIHEIGSIQRFTAFSASLSTRRPFRAYFSDFDLEVGSQQLQAVSVHRAIQEETVAKLEQMKQMVRDASTVTAPAVEPVVQEVRSGSQYNLPRDLKDEMAKKRAKQDTRS